MRYRWKRSGTKVRERPDLRTGVSKTPFGRWGQRFTMDYLADRKKVRSIIFGTFYPSMDTASALQ